VFLLKKAILLLQHMPTPFAAVLPLILINLVVKRFRSYTPFGVYRSLPKAQYFDYQQIESIGVFLDLYRAIQQKTIHFFGGYLNSRVTPLKEIGQSLLNRGWIRGLECINYFQ
jgi:hypothetical protein